MTNREVRSKGSWNVGNCRGTVRTALRHYAPFTKRVELQQYVNKAYLMLASTARPGKPYSEAGTGLVLVTFSQ
jgi:hypothetical protein